MTCFLKVCLLGVFYAGHAGASDYPPPCSVKKTLYGYIKEIRVNRKNFYALFTSHLYKEPDLLWQIIDDKSISDPIIKAGVLRRIARNEKYSSVIRSEKGDVAAIIGLLKSKQSSIRWIGIEASSKEMKKVGFNKQDQISVYGTVKRYLTTVLSFSEKEADDILYLMFSAYTISLAKQPQLFANIRFIPLDDDLYKSKTLNTLSKVEQAQRALYDLKDAGILSPEEFQKIMSTKREIMSSRGVLLSKIGLLNELKAPQSRAAAESYFVYINEFLNYSYKRDNTMASLAVKQQGEGLIILGEGHEKGVTTLLLSLCRGL